MPRKRAQVRKYIIKPDRVEQCEIRSLALALPLPLPLSAACLLRLRERRQLRLVVVVVVVVRDVRTSYRRGGCREAVSHLLGVRQCGGLKVPV